MAAFALALAPAMIGLAGCNGGPRGPAFSPSAAATHERQVLGETAPLRQAFAEAGPAADRLAEGAEALAGRTDALRARAQALEGPVVEPARRERMLAAASGG